MNSFPNNDGLSTLKEHTSSVAPPTNLILSRQRLVNQATQRPAKLARELADKKLKTGSQPINITGALGGDVRPLFAMGTCSRSPLWVRSTTCSATFASTEGHAPIARLSPAGGATASIATSTTMPARKYDITPRIIASRIPARSASVTRTAGVEICSGCSAQSENLARWDYNMTVQSIRIEF
jgi:hypothetical protein